MFEPLQKKKVKVASEAGVSHLLKILVVSLQIERDTFGKLQCHPYPHEYVDQSKQCAHRAFFMGLQRGQGELVQDGQQFDIRGTVDEFRHQVNMYMYWKPGMEMFVSHVRRKQIPSYVLPDGYKRNQTPRPMSGQLAEKPSSTICRSSSGERGLKRKKELEGAEENQQNRDKRPSISPPRRDSSSPELIVGQKSGMLLQQRSATVSGGNRKSEEISNNFTNDKVQFAVLDKGAHVESTKSRGAQFEESAVGSVYRSSGVANLVEAGTFGDPVHELLQLSHDGRAVDSTGCNSICSSQGDLYRADSKSLLNNVCENGSRYFEDALLELEVLNKFIWPLFSLTSLILYFICASILLICHKRRTIIAIFMVLTFDQSSFPVFYEAKSCTWSVNISG